MTDPYAIAGYAFLGLVAVFVVKWRGQTLPQWAWHRYVLQPTGHWWKRRKALWWGRWRPKKQRPPMPQSLRQHVFKRDHYRCRVPNRYGRPCGNEAGHGSVLEPHHWLPWKHFPGLFYDTRHLVTACLHHNRELGAKVPVWAYDWDDKEAIRTGRMPPKLGRARTWRGVEVQPDPRLVPNPR